MASRERESRGRRDHLERAVLQVLWSSAEPVAAADVVAALPDRDLAVTTVLTVLERLRRKGLVQRERVGRSYVHRAARSQEDLTAEAMLAVLTEDAGDGQRRSLALARFAASITPTDAAALREELDRAASRASRAPVTIDGPVGGGVDGPADGPADGPVSGLGTDAPSTAVARGCASASGTCGCCTCGPDCSCCAPSSSATSSAPRDATASSDLAHR